LRAGGDIIVVLLASRRLAESADSDARITYAMPTTHDVFWLSLEADKAVDIGSKQLPILPIALEAFSAKGHCSLSAVLHVGEQGYDVPLDIRTDQSGGKMLGGCKIVNAEEARRTIEGAEDF
jgi:hypothetical protein